MKRLAIYSILCCFPFLLIGCGSDSSGGTGPSNDETTTGALGALNLANQEFEKLTRLRPGDSSESVNSIISLLGSASDLTDVWEEVIFYPNCGDDDCEDNMISTKQYIDDQLNPEYTDLIGQNVFNLIDNALFGLCEFAIVLDDIDPETNLPKPRDGEEPVTLTAAMVEGLKEHCSEETDMEVGEELTYVVEDASGSLYDVMVETWEDDEILDRYFLKNDDDFLRVAIYDIEDDKRFLLETDKETGNTRFEMIGYFHDEYDYLLRAFINSEDEVASLFVKTHNGQNSHYSLAGDISEEEGDRFAKLSIRSEAIDNHLDDFHGGDEPVNVLEGCFNINSGEIFVIGDERCDHIDAEVFRSVDGEHTYDLSDLEDLLTGDWNKTSSQSDLPFTDAEEMYTKEPTFLDQD